jgi:hypothetical protein
VDGDSAGSDLIDATSTSGGHGLNITTTGSGGFDADPSIQVTYKDTATAGLLGFAAAMSIDAFENGTAGLLALVL